MTLLDPIAAESLREASIPVLETERLVLRAPRPEDAENIAMLANERRIAENTARIPHPYTLADAEAFLAAANRSDRETTFVIALTEGTLIGACGLELRDGPGTAGLMPELGCWLGVPYWGRGFATEAVRALIDHAFTDLELEALQAGARVTNPASRRVLEKCGFQWTGVGLYRIRALKSSAPIDRFRLERSIWASLKSWGRSRRVA
ncbi:MAG: GNAT family N-acetyltransferase [Alphaproteobacteria bacterium]|nr:MAG: GNAT family N-acetyltransferase [Alphaproteobacteria bacterium]